MTDQQVIELRHLYAQGGCTITALARRYGVSKMVAGYALRGVTYAYLPGAVTGSGHEHRRKLTAAQVAEARRLYKVNPLITYRELATRYGVPLSSLYCAMTGLSYKDVDQPPTAAWSKTKGPRGGSGQAKTIPDWAASRRKGKIAKAQRLAEALAQATGKAYAVIQTGKTPDVVPLAEAPQGVEILHHARPN